MNILVMGGSYFVGKNFVNLAKAEHNITVYNRGNRPLNIAGVEELIGDRNDINGLHKLSGYNFDAVVDFCAYNKGDIGTVLDVLGNNIKQYIFISTVDVYQHGSGETQNEDAPYENRMISGPEGEYIAGKIALEKELVEMSSLHNVEYTVFRPAMIYGPGNYAPREGIYFHWINNAGQILHPSDASGEFQFVYVSDVSKAVLKAIGNKSAFNQVFNLVNNNVYTYDSYIDALDRCLGKKSERVLLPVETIMSKAIPLPFALTKEESNLYDGTKALCLIEEYTEFDKGLRETIAANTVITGK